MAGNQLSDEDVARLGPKARQQVKDATPLSATEEPHRARPKAAPASRPKAAPKAQQRPPKAAAPKAGPGVGKRAGAFVERTTNRVDRKVGGALSKHGRSVFVAEMVAAMFLIGVSYVAENKTAPPPSKFIAAFTVYLVLGFVSEFGDSAQRFAAAFGGLFLLMLIIMHAKGIITVMTFVAGGAQGQQQAPATPPPGPPGGTMAPAQAPGAGRVPQLGRTRGQVR